MEPKHELNIGAVMRKAIKEEFVNKGRRQFWASQFTDYTDVDTALKNLFWLVNGGSLYGHAEVYCDADHQIGNFDFINTDELQAKLEKHLARECVDCDVVLRELGEEATIAYIFQITDEWASELEGSTPQKKTKWKWNWRNASQLG